MVRIGWGVAKVGISLPKPLLSKIDDLADEVELSRSEVVADLLDYCLKHGDIIDEIYPLAP